MRSDLFTALIQHIRRLTVSRGVRDLTDAHLLERFASQRDEAAFVALLQRHGPLVWGLCRSMFANVQDAEDVLQATFLVLVRKARSIRKQQSLASWLHGVAYRIAARAKASTSRRQGQERQGVKPMAIDPGAEGDLREWGALLHEEVTRLPVKYRVPILLCYLEGKTRGEAAQQLGWSIGSAPLRRWTKGRRGRCSWRFAGRINAGTSSSWRGRGRSSSPGPLPG